MCGSAIRVKTHIIRDTPTESGGNRGGYLTDRPRCSDGEVSVVTFVDLGT